ncbi:hypothetical protein CATYP_02850 [Corynebacterium atypicum]|uniref:ATP-binding protein n=1 Tax=Corynebacterium atypicum TaxID=191610 RepID=A0ABM5QLW8_9CORY|nr:DUF3107 domain-containing protein [Corynebacterium atypicum]AIG63797.1 hypothetical protein CATYP_02850 [Corynebacterium atypicum]
MELKIGFKDSPRELAIEAKGGAGEISAAVRAALDGSSPLLQLTDARDHQYVVRAESVAWVSIGAEARRAVGFGGASA